MRCCVCLLKELQNLKHVFLLQIFGWLLLCFETSFKISREGARRFQGFQDFVSETTNVACHVQDAGFMLKVIKSRFLVTQGLEDHVKTSSQRL